MELFHPITVDKPQQRSKILIRYDCKKNVEHSIKSDFGKPILKQNYLSDSIKAASTTLNGNEDEKSTKNLLNERKDIRIINMCCPKLETQNREVLNETKFPILDWRDKSETTHSGTKEANTKCIKIRRKSLDSNISNFSSTSSNSRKQIEDIPLSPESVNKIELCSYLKLRNLNSCNHINDSNSRSRRSSRVKNLQILCKKKELERELNVKNELKLSDLNDASNKTTTKKESLNYNPTDSNANPTVSYNLNHNALKRKKYTIMTIEKDNFQSVNNINDHSCTINKNCDTIHAKLDVEKTLVESNFPEGPELTPNSFKKIQLRFNEQLTSLNFIEACSKMFHPRTIPTSVLKKRINFEDSIKDIIVHRDIIKNKQGTMSQYKNSIKCGSKIKKKIRKNKIFLRSRNSIKTRLQILHCKASHKGKRHLIDLKSSNSANKPIKKLLKRKLKIKREKILKAEKIKKKEKKIKLRKKNLKDNIILDVCLTPKEKFNNSDIKLTDDNTTPLVAMKEHDYVAQTNHKNNIDEKSFNGVKEISNLYNEVKNMDILKKLKQKCVIHIKPLKISNVGTSNKRELLEEVFENSMHANIAEVPKVQTVMKNNFVSLSDKVCSEKLLLSECQKVEEDINFKGFVNSYCNVPNAMDTGLNFKKTLSSFLSKSVDEDLRKNCTNKQIPLKHNEKAVDETVRIETVSCNLNNSQVNTLTCLINSIKTTAKDNQHSEEQDVSSTTDFQKDSQMITVRKLAVKTLHRNLIQSKKPAWKVLNANRENDLQTLTTSSSKEKKKHTIHISEENGRLLSCQYHNYNLVVIQENIISFWTQSPLGSLLEAQNMWIPRGSVQRLKPDNGSLLNICKENITCTENSIACVELWTKEHTSDKRESPLADVFAVIYFWKAGQTGLDKKFLQLETINGFAEDVRCVILRNTPNILVTWRIIKDDAPLSLIHCYQLADDYRTIASVKEMVPVHHGIRSLHNVEDSDAVVMGCGDHNITLWNLEYGYLVATINIDDKLPEPSCLWAKCDRGFLFTVQNHSDGMMKLIAINGINHSWKRLQAYKTPMGYRNLHGISIDNGVLVSFFDNGILCWNMESAELIAEELSTMETYFPSGKYIITYNTDQELKVKNSISYIMKNYDCME